MNAAVKPAGRKPVELTPAQVLLLSFSIVILIGSVFLYLPISHTRPIRFIDALFTACSATTVTGLIVLDTPKDFTLFGQLVILILIQLGGLGYMTFATYFLLTVKGKVKLEERMVLSESMGLPSISGILTFLRNIFPLILIIELFGMVIMLPVFLIKGFSIPTAFYHAIFHSVSAFNNAGFSSFSDNLMSYRGDIVINLVVSFLIVVGGIGFFVINETLFIKRRKNMKFSEHTKLVLLLTTVLLTAGFLIFFIFEFLPKPEYPMQEKILAAFFTSVVARTAGFNTVDFSTMSEANLFFMINLMFIGASPGGTGGGIKTITVGIIGAAVYSFVRSKKETVIFNRRVPEKLIHKAMVIVSLSFIFNSAVSFFLSELEHKSLIHTLFEVVSAFATVGLSVGNPDGLSLTADFSDLGKILIMFSMLAGRLGILSFVLAVFGNEKDRNIKHPEAKLLL